MRVSISVQTKAKSNQVSKLSSVSYKVKTTSAPEKGKANKEIIKLLAVFFNKKRSEISLISGRKSSQKVFEVAD